MTAMGRSTKKLPRKQASAVLENAHVKAPYDAKEANLLIPVPLASHGPKCVMGKTMTAMGQMTMVC